VSAPTRNSSNELATTVTAQQNTPTSPKYGAFKDFLNADWSFHRLIAGNTGNRFLAQAFESFNGYMQRYRIFGGHVVDGTHESTAEHQEILTALRTGDSTGATAAMRAHLEHRCTCVQVEPFAPDSE